MRTVRIAALSTEVELESGLISAYEEVSGQKWLTDIGRRWEQAKQAGDESHYLWHWVCSGDLKLISETGESLTAKNVTPEILEGALPDLWMKLSGENWLAEIAWRWEQSKQAGSESHYLWCWVCTGDSKLISRTGEILTTENVTPEILEGGLPDLWMKLSGEKWLRQAAVDWNEYWPKTESLSCGTLKERALPWIIGNHDLLVSKAQELLAVYGGSSKKSLNVLWKKSKWGIAEYVALCSADISLLESKVNLEKKLREDRIKSMQAKKREQLNLCLTTLVVFAAVVLIMVFYFENKYVNLEVVKKAALEKKLAEAAAQVNLEKASTERRVNDELARQVNEKKENEETELIAKAAKQKIAFSLKKINVWERGSLIVWERENFFEQHEVPEIVPEILPQVIAIAAGNHYGLALLKDGTVVSWGGSRECEVPSELSGVVAVAVGAGYDSGPHSLALKKNGTVVAWGNNEYGQCNVPDSLHEVVAIAAARTHSLALKKDGSVISWGATVNVPADLRGVVAISAGGTDRNLALKSDGTVIAWGANTNVPPSLGDVVSISVGYNHNLALKRDGTVVAWGYNASRQCEVPSELVGVVAVAAGPDYSLALKSNGMVVSWGNVADFQVPLDLNHVRSIAAGFDWCMALKKEVWQKL